MIQIAMVALGGAFGAVCRFMLVNAIGGRAFPWGTLTVNVIGSCLMGIAYIYIMERNILSPEMKPLLMSGFLGAFTTFSAFSLESWELLDRGEPILAVGYIVASVLLCILALIVGVSIARFTL